MGLPGAAGPAGNQTTPLGDELGAEDAAEQGEADAGLKGEIELVDGFQEREAGAPHAALDPGLSAVGDLFGDQQGEEVAIAEPVGLGPLGELGFSKLTPELAAKRLALLKEAVPAISRVAVLWNPAYSEFSADWREIRQAAEKLGVSLHPVSSRVLIRDRGQIVEGRVPSSR